MKNLNIFIFLLCAFFTQALLAQAPQGFNYQAVARDINDQIIKDEFISMRFWVLADNSAGAPVYREVHTGVYTGINGIITRVIGSGTSDVGSFASIDWGAKNYFIRVDMDVKNGTNFTQMGTSQLMSVPYALFALKSGNGGSGGADNWGTQKVVSNQTLLGDGTPGNPLRIDVSEVNTDNQVLSINGSQLSISNGNSISIPTGGTDADADPTNELQDLSKTTSGNNVDINISGGTGVSFSVEDEDSNSSNELQDLSNSKNNNDVTVNITDGTSTTFSVEDSDSDDTNELQDLSKTTSGNNVEIKISGGTGVSFSVADGDSNSSNEIQSLSVSGTNLSISNGNTVALPNGLWSKNPQFLGIHYDNEVSIGMDGVFGELNVNGRGVFVNPANPTARTTVRSSGIINLTSTNGKSVDLGDFDHGKIVLYDDTREIALLDKTTEGGGFFGLTNQFGVNRVVQIFARNDNGVGQMETYGASNLNTYVGHDASDPRHGHIAVFDTNENNKAGIAVNASGQGILYADVKNFRMDYPGRSEKEIWYASLEGPEAGAYERGTATLINGEATIPFSDHFGLVIIEKGMTVMLTPLSGESLGLAVVEKTKTGFKVKELNKGTGNYSFDWEVKGVRKGFEKYEVIRDKSYARPSSASNIK